jgi:nucleotide-binding universal stress UspA family protein
MTAEAFMLQIRNVLVAADFGKASDAALQYGRNIARTFGATLHVLHVVDDVYARGLEAESLNMWAEQQDELQQAAVENLRQRVTPDDARTFNERVVTRVAGNTADAIVEFAGETPIDLIVMGTHGREAVDPHDIGSVSARVVHGAPCPVLTVKRALEASVTAAVTRSTAAE